MQFQRAILHSINFYAIHGVKMTLPHFVGKNQLVPGEVLINSSRCCWYMTRIQYCAFQAYPTCHPLSPALASDRLKDLAYQILNYGTIAVLFTFWRFNSQSIFRFWSRSFNKVDLMLKQILSVQRRLELHSWLFICSLLCLHWQSHFSRSETMKATLAGARQILYSSKLEQELRLLTF